MRKRERKRENQNRETYFREGSPCSRTVDWACCVLKRLSPPLGSCTPWTASGSRPCRTCRCTALWSPSSHSMDRPRRCCKEQMRRVITFAIQPFATWLQVTRNAIVARTLTIWTSKSLRKILCRLVGLISLSISWIFFSSSFFTRFVRENILDGGCAILKDSIW